MAMKINNDNYYNTNVEVYHSTTIENYNKIKLKGELIPTDHIFFNKIFTNRLHLSTDLRAHKRMIRAIADEREGFDLKDILTLTILYPSYVPEGSDCYDIEYKNCSLDNNSNYDGYSIITSNSIEISRITKVE